jgi:di/tricarboxylate transporter
VVFAASQSFLSPIGYQTNLMVYAPGRYRFLDFFRFGWPLSLAYTLMVPLLLIWFA